MTAAANVRVPAPFPADHCRQILFLDVHRMLPETYVCRKLVRETLNDALNQITSLVHECYALDSRQSKLLYVIYQLQLSNGAEAALWFLRLDRPSQCFLMFALEIYGLKLVSYQI